MKVKVKREGLSLPKFKSEEFPNDQYLRSFGWRVLRRPFCGPAIWINSAGVEMEEQAAVAHVVGFLRGDHKKPKTGK